MYLIWKCIIIYLKFNANNLGGKYWKGYNMKSMSAHCYTFNELIKYRNLKNIIIKYEKNWVIKSVK